MKKIVKNCEHGDNEEKIVENLRKGQKINQKKSLKIKEEILEKWQKLAKRRKNCKN